VSFIIFVAFTAQLILQHPNGNLLDFEAISDYATSISGIFSFLSIVLIYYTLKHQSFSFNRTQFENRLFELIRYHRDNVSITRLRCPAAKTEIYYEGHKALREIHKQVLKAVDDIKPLIKTLEDIYISEELKNHELDYYEKHKGISLLKLNQYNIAYLSVFYGMSAEGVQAFKEKLKGKYKSNLINSVINLQENKYAAWSKAVNKKDNVKYFGGHQYRLGHYFRHLFQTFNYIDNNEDLSYIEKYEYTKIIRAQLSTYEQTLLFFNSISELGRPWELSVSYNERIRECTWKDYWKYKCLITKYDIIRNVTNEFVPDIKIKDFYPELTFDGEKDSKRRRKLNNLFSKKATYFTQCRFEHLKYVFD
jgi:hypothetical protein